MWGGGDGCVEDMNIRPPYFIHKTHCHDLFYRTVQYHEKDYVH